MAENVNDKLDAAVEIISQVAHSTADTVQTEAGPIRTLHKLMADLDAEAAAILPQVTPTAQAAAQAVVTDLVGEANGLAPLGSDSKIAAIYLPSFVDDVLEFPAFANLPTEGETGKIYIAVATNKQYRWSGSTYVELVAAPGSTDAVVEGNNNLYFTNARVVAAVLTGYTVAATAAQVAATDTIRVAFGKLQKLVNDLSAANTGDETTATIKTKLGITTLSGSNTGDQTLASLAAIGTAEKGAANGVAPLGSDSKIAAIYLPSFVDDVLEFATLAAFPSTGETGKIYVALATNLTYRWSGSAYIQLVASPGTTDAVTEGTGNLYFTAARAIGSALTGYTVAGANAAIAATDTILAAFGKVQKQLNDMLVFAKAYDFHTFVLGKPTASGTVLLVKAVRAFTIPASATGSVGLSETAAAATATFTIYKNGASVGTIQFAASATAATFTVASAVSFAVGDVLKVSAPTAQDTGLSNVAISLLVSQT